MAVRWKRAGSAFLIALGIGVIFVIIAFPLYWMVITSFKPYKEIFQRVPTFFPQRPVVEHYIAIVQDGLFRYFAASSLVRQGVFDVLRGEATFRQLHSRLLKSSLLILLAAMR